MDQLIKETIELFKSNPKSFIGFIIFVFGIILFGIGRKMPIIRLFLGDKSLFYQLFFGALISIIGIALIFLFK